MNGEAQAEIYVLAAQLNAAADRAIIASEALREALSEFAEARRELTVMLRELRRPALVEPWRALNLN